VEELGWRLHTTTRGGRDADRGSGHRGFTPEVTDYSKGIRRAEPYRGEQLVGLSCLAEAPINSSAQAVLVLATIEVFIPAEQYRAGLPTRLSRLYDELLGRASAAHLP